MKGVDGMVRGRVKEQGLRCIDPVTVHLTALLQVSFTAETR